MYKSQGKKFNIKLADNAIKEMNNETASVENSIGIHKIRCSLWSDFQSPLMTLAKLKKGTRRKGETIKGKKIPKSSRFISNVDYFYLKRLIFPI